MLVLVFILQSSKRDYISPGSPGFSSKCGRTIHERHGDTSPNMFRLDPSHLASRSHMFFAYSREISQFSLLKLINCLNQFWCLSCFQHGFQCFWVITLLFSRLPRPKKTKKTLECRQVGRSHPSGPALLNRWCCAQWWFQHIKGMVQGMFIFISVLNSVVAVILVLSRESIPIE